MQPRLDERVVEHRVLFATGHKGEVSQIGEHRPRAILSVEPEQGTLLQELMHSLIATNGRKSLAQFCSVASVASVAKRAELTFNCGPD